MKYLWSLFLVGENDGSFKFTECTFKYEERGQWIGVGEKSYSPDNAIIKPIFDAAIELCKILGLELNSSKANHYLFIRRDVRNLIVMHQELVFVAIMEDGQVKVRTKNSYSFAKEQFDAIFEFIDLLIKHNWFN